MQHTLSILSHLSNSISASMENSIYQCAMSVNALSGVNKSFNTDNIPQFNGTLLDGIVCGASKCGSDSNPNKEYCRLD